MEIWMLFWKIVFFVSITAFAAMSVWVIIFGAFDIKKMLTALRDDVGSGDSDADR